MDRYVHYCRSTCGPRLTAAASEKLVSQFVLIRREAKQQEVEANGKRSVIPITVRQLEAIVRISESLAKMRLEPYATEEHVDEALRLFKVSTLDAAAVGRFEDTEGMGTHTLSEFTEIETRIKGQFPLGSRVSEATILERIKFPTSAVRKVIAVMVRRGELEYRDQRKSLWRVR
jgi:DNA replication licensing factor MCM5